MTTDKKTCEALIDKLADKTLSFGCVVKIKLYQNDDWHDGEYLFGGDSDAPLIPEGSVYYIHFTAYRNTDFVDGHTLKVNTDDIKKIKILGHEVKIGDVLEKMEEIQKHPPHHKSYDNKDHTYSQVELLSAYWGKCGFTKSLNQIMECGFEGIGQETMDEETGKYYIQNQLKDPNARKLFEFLIPLFLKP